jgi:hypothetical protein
MVLTSGPVLALVGWLAVSTTPPVPAGVFEAGRHEGGVRAARLLGEPEEVREADAQQPPSQPALPGIDGPISQEPNGIPAVPFVMVSGGSRTTAEIMAEQAAADLAGVSVQRPLLPERELPTVPLDPNAIQDSQWPPAAGDQPASDLESPTVLTPSTVIEGPQLGADSAAVPPDTMGDVGPTQYIIALNGRIRSYNKTTGAADGVLNTADSTFFNTVRNAAGTTDPRIRYDAATGRWYIVYITIAVPNRIVLAVSNSPTITGATVWTYAFTANTVVNGSSQPCLADYETLGVDNNALYMGVNQFCGTSVDTATFFNTSAFIVNKATLGTASPTVTLISPLIDGTGGPLTPQGVDNYDASTVGYLIGTSASSTTALSLVRIANPGTAPSATKVNVATPLSRSQPIGVPHLGDTRSMRLDAVSDRLINAVARGGSLWTSHAIGTDAAGVATGAPSRDAVRWYEIQNIATAPTVRQSGTIFDAAASNPTFFWVPSININTAGDVVVGYAASSAVTFAGAAASHRRVTDALGTMQAPQSLISGAAAYNVNDGVSPDTHRWGDYSMVSVDAADGVTFWTAQMYTRSADVWGTRAIRLAVSSGAAGLVAPANFRTASIAGNTVTFAWDASPSPGITSYIIEGGTTPGSVLASLPTGSAATTTVLTVPTGIFFVRVKATNGTTVSAASNEIQIFVNVPAPPSAPSNLLGLVNGSTLGLSWLNTLSGGTPTSLILNVTGSIVTSLPLPVSESFSFAGVPAGTYTLTVVAANASGLSAASNPVTLTFPGACSGAPGTPTGFSATKSGSTITVAWNPPASGAAVASYTLQVTGTFVGSFPTTGRTLSGSVAPGSYTLSVSAANACGTSAATAPVTVTVP